jgi:uncharacterized protein (DUF433 family)
MNVERAVVVDPDVMNGTPCFRGTRVPFKNLIDYFEGGHSLGEFLEQFPSVTRGMAIQALEEAKGFPASPDRVKILPDECLPLSFRYRFPNHDAHTVQWACLKGEQNGEIAASRRGSLTSPE